MRRWLPYLALLFLGLGLSVGLAGCSRGHEEPGASRLNVPRLCDPTPYDRVNQDDGDYIQSLSR
jgi:hypothetical protein